ncbi:bifunctional DNA primase/polymerase [Streptomyces yaizuensis]|uniref:Bifunctional DNA primase/polymerase n=1 Tax=Streptomyces yaizuensis TaxID=2989713 RepID=A0ABQ5NZL5_9ACTN|nr:bifunctional DNA primase/polymerase [Streptomyces sp. YSPA8]GLF95792.1 bifunctional DNA primase/polymerase [Streptomyces sp. YSPA8]
MAITDRQSASLALGHALAAAERGFPVLPLSPTKLPAVRSPHRASPDATAGAPCRGECGRPGHGVHDATTDPERVRALFAAAPWATGYGIACGRAPHHLIGIDLDVHAHDGRRPLAQGTTAGSLTALHELALRHLFTIPETVTVLTPSGGRHLWLTGPPGVTVPNSVGRLAPGIDVRGGGGYLVGPGSVTAYGAYRLAPGSARLSPAPCPRALLRLVAAPERPRGPVRSADPGRIEGRSEGQGEGQGEGRDEGRGEGRGEGLVRFVRTAHAGQRNTRLFWAACRAYENGIGESLADDLAAAAVDTGLSDQEARATIASAARLTAGRGARR